MAGVIKRLLDYLFGPRLTDAEQDRLESARLHRDRVRQAQQDALARARRHPEVYYRLPRADREQLDPRLQGLKDDLNRELFG